MKPTKTVRSFPLHLVVLLVLTAAIAAAAGWWIGRRGAAPPAPSAEATARVWYCVMHPQIRQPRPGKCPICFMDLVPLAESSDPGPRAIEVSPSAMARADIETARVERRRVETTLRFAGMVEFDETRVKSITARVAGRLDRLFVDYTGVPVKQGEHIAEVYSPQILATQQQLLEALQAVGALSRSSSDIVRQSTLATLESVRDKLRLWGLSAEQIQDIEQRGTTSDHIVLLAPASGVVIEKLANEGDYVETGQTIYRIGAVDPLWVKLDAYESDLAWLRYGQKARFSTEAEPARVFEGTITFIDWVVHRPTRTVKVRLNVANADGSLKPGMFVRAEVNATLHGAGRILDPSLAGKWISPMHPEVIKDGPGACDICGMALVPAAEHFNAVVEGPADAPIVVPASAPLITGKRAIVYVRLPERQVPTFEGREVVLGPRAGDRYVVRSGLAEGDEVVTRGNFKIDSALQIQAKPSMMQPEEGAAPPSGAADPHAGHRHEGGSHD